MVLLEKIIINRIVLVERMRELNLAVYALGCPRKSILKTPVPFFFYWRCNVMKVEINRFLFSNLGRIGWLCCSETQGHLVVGT